MKTNLKTAATPPTRRWWRQLAQVVSQRRHQDTWLSRSDFNSQQLA